MGSEAIVRWRTLRQLEHSQSALLSLDFFQRAELRRLIRCTR